MRDDDPLAPPEDDPGSPPPRPKRREPRPTDAERATPEESAEFTEARDDPSPAEAEREAEPEPQAGTEPDRHAEPEPAAESESKEKSGSHILHKGEFTAPSVGPNTVIERRPPEERLDFDKISDVDAMGRDKRRTVVGGSYGPTRTRVFATFATFFAVLAAVLVGLYFLAQELDQPPEENVDQAPWSAPAAEQSPPRPLQ